MKKIATFYKRPFMLTAVDAIGITVIKPRTSSYTYLMSFTKKALEEIFRTRVHVTKNGDFYVWGIYNWNRESYYRNHLVKE